MKTYCKKCMKRTEHIKQGYDDGYVQKYKCIECEKRLNNSKVRK